MTPRCAPFSNLYSDGSLMLPEYANPSYNGATPSVLVRPGTSVSVMMTPTTVFNDVSFVWSVWAMRTINSSQTTQPQTLLAFGTAQTTTAQYVSLAYENDFLLFSYDLRAGSPDVRTPTTQLEQSVWVHWLVSVEHVSTSVSYVTIYKNGQPVPANTTFFNPNSVLVSNTAANVRLTIGAGSTSSTARNNYFAGLIDEVQLYSGTFFTATDALRAYGNIFTNTADRVYWAHFMTPDFIAVMTTTSFPDAAGKQGTTALLPTVAAATMPGPILWANNYTNPLCLPRPSGLRIRASDCAAVGSTFTFEVHVIDWMADKVQTFQGGSVRMSYPLGAAAGTTWENSTHGTFSGRVATSSFVDGVATFAIRSSNPQDLVVTSDDYLPIFSGNAAAQTGPAADQTHTIGFVVARAFTFQSVTAGVVGSPVTVTVALTSCDTQIITGVSISVSVLASNGAMPSSTLLTIDPVTGVGTAQFTRSSVGSAFLSLSDTAATGNDVSATSTAAWSDVATTFAVTLTSPLQQTVLGAYTFLVFTADASMAQAAFDGTCILQLTATGTGSYKNPMSQLYLNKEPINALNFSFTALQTSYPLTIQSSLVQTVTLSWASFCSNLTVAPSNMLPASLNFANGPRTTFSISTPYPMLSASMGSTVPFVVYALDLYGNIVPSTTGVSVVIRSANANGVGTCTRFSFSGMGASGTGTAATTASTATVPCTNGVCKVDIRNDYWGVCRWSVDGWPGTFATCLWYDPSVQDFCPFGTMVSSHWAPGYYYGGQAIFSNTGDVINLAGQSWTLFTFMSPIMSVTSGTAYMFAIGTTAGIDDAMCISVNFANCLQMEWGSVSLSVCAPAFRYSFREWTAVVFQYDAVEQTMSIFQQGFLIATKKATPMMAVGPVTIGNCPHLNAITTGGTQGAKTMYQMQLDETYLYQRVLSPAEIYSASVYHSMPNPAGLVVWLAYDDPNSTPALRDTSGHGFDFLVQYDAGIIVMTHYGVCLPTANTISFQNLPASTRAGSSFSVDVRVLDPAGLITNTFTSTSYAGWVNVSCSGSAVCPPALFFQQSTATLVIYDAVPEVVTVSLVDGFPTGLNMPVATTLEFSAGTLATVQFSTTPAGSQQPGQWVAVRLQAVDDLGVIRSDESREIGIEITPATNMELLPATRVSFSSGYATVYVRSNSTGAFVLATSNPNSIPGLGAMPSGDVFFTDSASSVRATYSAPGATCGESITVTLTLMSGAQEVLWQNSAIAVSLSGAGQPRSAVVQLVNGVGTLLVRDTVAEVITVSFDNRTNTLVTPLLAPASSPLTFTVGVAVKLVIKPQSYSNSQLVAGKTNTVPVWITDQFGNLVTTAPSPAGIQLYAVFRTGTAPTLIPSNGAITFTAGAGSVTIQSTAANIVTLGLTNVLTALDATTREVYTWSGTACTQFVVADPSTVTGTYNLRQLVNVTIQCLSGTDAVDTLFTGDQCGVKAVPTAAGLPLDGLVSVMP